MILALLLATAAAPPATTLWDAPPALSMNMDGLPPIRLPAELDEWVRDRLEAYRLYPAQCQTQLNGLRLSWDKLVDVAVATSKTDHAFETAELRSEVAGRWPTWALAGAGVLGVILGVGIAWLGAQLAATVTP